AQAPLESASSTKRNVNVMTNRFFMAVNLPVGSAASAKLVPPERQRQGEPDITPTRTRANPCLRHDLPSFFRAATRSRAPREFPMRRGPALAASAAIIYASPDNWELPERGWAIPSFSLPESPPSRHVSRGRARPDLIF